MPYNTNKPDMTIDVDLNFNTPNTKTSLNEVMETVEELVELTHEIEIPDIRPIINFYGCSFNFANDGCAESRYYNGSDIYNQRKED